MNAADSDLGGADGAGPDDLLSDVASEPVELGEHLDAEETETEELEATSAQKVLPAPSEATPAHREAHHAEAQIPYRWWCEECAAARATGEQHRRGRWMRRVCVFAFDYLFLDKTSNVITRTA